MTQVNNQTENNILNQGTIKKKTAFPPKLAGQGTVYKQGANPTLIYSNDVTKLDNETYASKQPSSEYNKYSAG